MTALLLALVTIAAACGGAAGSTSGVAGASHTKIAAGKYRAAASGVLRMSGTPDLTLDPPNANGETDILVLHNVYQTLVGYDWANSKIVPELAQRWTVSDGGKVYTFYLDPKAKFVSGDPVTANDVKYSLDRVVQDATAAQAYQLTPYLTSNSVAVVNAHTVRITLASASPAFLAALTGTAASILDSTVVKAHETGGDLSKGWLAANTAGSGPFTVSQWLKDSSITLVRNPHYDGPTPQLKTVVIEYVTSEPQAVSLLRGGSLDAATNVLPGDVKALKKQGYQVVTGQNPANYYLSMNMLPNLPFHSPLVRDAVRYAIDYKGLLGTVLGGEAVRIGGVIAKGMVGYDPKLNHLYDTNVAKAKQLLAKAGYPHGFSTDMYYQSDSPVLGVPADTIAAKIQSDLAQVGINVSLHGEPSATVFPQYKAGQLPLVFWWFGPTFPDPDVIMTPHGDWNAQATQRVHFDDTKVTQLITEARTTLNSATRAKLYDQAQAIVAKVGPYAFLFRPLQVTVVRKGVTFPWVPIWTVELAKASAN